MGLKHGIVELDDYDPQWKTKAAEAIELLWRILGSSAKDIQHIGSTAICNIKAKPVIDIAVAVNNFDEVLKMKPELERKGFFFRGWEGKDEGRQPVFQCGEYVPGEKYMRLLTHYIHIVLESSPNWNNYINFRDYMNAFPAVAKEYEAHKLEAVKRSDDSGNYHKIKQDYVVAMIQIACL